jgi:hypothetical protein
LCSVTAYVEGREMTIAWTNVRGGKVIQEKIWKEIKA